MSTNKQLWDRVCKTDPKHVKPITGKDYGGNSPKPYWIVERLTEEFGPCGIGWGYVIESERFERFSDTDVLHIAKVRLWYDLNGKRGDVEQMGQTKASYWTSKGTLKVDEDAPKKSVTDALVKCASYLGFAGDIFSGRWDDSKYVNELRKEFAEKTEERNENGTLPGPKHKPTDGAMEALPEDDQLKAQLAASVIVAKYDGKEGIEAVTDVWALLGDADVQKAVWALLGPRSEIRSAIKREQEKRRLGGKAQQGRVYETAETN